VIHTHTCVTLACDDCASDYDDDYTMHFADVDTARRHAEAASWTVTGEHILCDACAAHIACALTCHDWGPWIPVAQPRYCGKHPLVRHLRHRRLRPLTGHRRRSAAHPGRKRGPDMTRAALHCSADSDPHARAAPLRNVGPAAEEDAMCGLLQAGLHWLHDTAQPDDAVINAREAAAAVGEARLIWFVPLGWGWRASIVLEVAHVSWAAGPAGPPLNPLYPDDIDTLAAHLGTLDAAVTSTRCASAALAATITLARASHPSLQAAVTRSGAGCPTHHSRICGRPQRHGGQDCSWYGNGRRGVRWPFDPRS
jgi:hypothetical protein